MSKSVPSFRLNNGNTIPAIGIGCWMGTPGGDEQVRAAVEYALKFGYRHIDTAYAYANEADVGKGIRDSGVPREQIFVTTKLIEYHHGSVQDGLDASLKNLGLDYVDLYLMHWPQAKDANGKVLQPDEYPTFVDTWKEMEKLLDTGKVKNIGVSNFSPKNLDIFLTQVKVVPAVNQVEMHPLLPQVELLEYCNKQGIVLTAYTPFGKFRPELVQHASLKDITTRKGCTVSQALLGWFIKKGVVAIPKSTTEHRIEENLSFADLTPEEVAIIDDIHKAPGMHHSMCGYHGAGGTVFGWTYEQLGWPMKEGGIVS